MALSFLAFQVRAAFLSWEGETYLEGNLVRRLGGVTLGDVGGGDGGCVDVGIIGDDEPMAAVVQLEPSQHGPAGDQRAGNLAEPSKVVSKCALDGYLETNTCISGMRRPN